MDDLTILEWLEEQPISSNEIDFLITFIPNVSMIKVSPDKLEVMCQSFNRQFPKANLDANKDYTDYAVFTAAIQNYTDNKISVKELLMRMSVQNICKPICDYFLEMEKERQAP
ncbi:hypothetical protein [Paenibacillus agilis]|uniref:Uncharacterized protein n=1 Tax=Paenibacillus agilis TaxID=3020863 RepID=A0A559IVN5_9BACL|nr:hypothetical protein [Paenibacillus agilis]TVX91698.1 hypothetical protein FPZ44_00675 [Paenibacillus agilis]